VKANDVAGPVMIDDAVSAPSRLKNVVPAAASPPPASVKFTVPFFLSTERPLNVVSGPS
jgi:hypothetical protein